MVFVVKVVDEIIQGNYSKKRGLRPSFFSLSAANVVFRHSCGGWPGGLHLLWASCQEDG